jgi:hypothetical protein
MPGNSVIWTIVGILAILALIAFLVSHMHFT